MRKRYDWAWLTKMSLYVLGALGLIYVAISTIAVWAGSTWGWSFWELLSK